MFSVISIPDSQRKLLPSFLQPCNRISFSYAGDTFTRGQDTNRSCSFLSLPIENRTKSRSPVPFRHAHRGQPWTGPRAHFPDKRESVDAADEGVARDKCHTFAVGECAGDTRCEVRGSRRVRLAQLADYSEERPRWDGSLNATMLPRVWVERAGSESALLGRARPLSDLVDMPIDTVYMSMDMPCRAVLSYASTRYLLSCLLRP